MNSKHRSMNRFWERLLNGKSIKKIRFIAQPHLAKLETYS